MRASAMPTPSDTASCTAASGSAKRCASSPAVQQELIALTDIAPLHQPKSIAALGAVNQALPNLPAIACFDTAFHATLPPKASTYAIPAALRARWGLRRYGFHGLSHAWVARRVASLGPGITEGGQLSPRSRSLLMRDPGRDLG